MTNKNLYMDMINKDPGAWDFMNYLKSNNITILDREVARGALEKNGQILKFCSDDFKNDYELVKIAVTNNGMALDYASKNLKDNDDIVKIAMKLNQAILYSVISK